MYRYLKSQKILFTICIIIGRSLVEIKEIQQIKPSQPEPLEFDPTPFKFAEHGARYRRQQRPACYPDGIQYILFVLDSSGSIGKQNFDSVTANLSSLIALFCKPIRMAVMTFDHEYFLEFCFDCFDNTCSGRAGAMTALRKINYHFGRSGIRYTHTAGAVHCVCDRMLHHELCGLPQNANCIDVVFVTDGKSNDPNLEICSELHCLHRRHGLNTYAIGIGNVNQVELDCITNYNLGYNSLFNFASFSAFVNAIEDVKTTLTRVPSDGSDPYTCVDPSPQNINGIGDYVATNNC